MPIQRVLVGYDGNGHSERALQFAVGINDDYETEIHLAFIVNEPAGMAEKIRTLQLHADLEHHYH